MRNLGCIFFFLLFNVLLTSSAKAETRPVEKSHRSELIQKAFSKIADFETPKSSTGNLIIRVQPASPTFNSLTKSFISGFLYWLAERPQNELPNEKATDDCSLPAQQHLLFIFPFHNFW